MWGGRERATHRGLQDVGEAGDEGGLGSDGGEPVLLAERLQVSPVQPRQIHRWSTRPGRVGGHRHRPGFRRGRRRRDSKLLGGGSVRDSRSASPRWGRGGSEGARAESCAERSPTESCSGRSKILRFGRGLPLGASATDGKLARGVSPCWCVSCGPSSVNPNV